MVSALQGCVNSQFPLLDKKSLVVDPSLTGRYLLHDAAGPKPVEYDVYLKDTEYLLVRDRKLDFIGTLHRSVGGVYLAELRTLATPSIDTHLSPSAYTYMIVKKTGTGVELNLIGCTMNSPCMVKSVDELDKLVSAAVEHPDSSQIEVATKTGERGE